MCQICEIARPAKPIRAWGRLTLVKGGKKDMRYIDWDISSHAEKMVAFLLAVTVVISLL